MTEEVSKARGRRNSSKKAAPPPSPDDFEDLQDADPDEEYDEDNDPRLTTLADLGSDCPIPMQNGDYPDFEFRPWRMLEEKKIGEIKARQKSIGVFVREVFEYMLSSFNGKDWDSYNKNDRKMILNQMPWGNIFYMYFYLRYDALGEEVKMQEMKCTECAAPIEGYTADLNSLEVRRALPKDPSVITVKLKKPVKVGDVKVTAVRGTYTPWDAMEKVKSHTRNEGSLKDSMLMASIVGFEAEDHGEVDLAKVMVLRQLAKRDIENIYTTLDRHNGGPVLGIDITCPACGHEWTNVLNWSYDYFFGSSSLSQS